MKVVQINATCGVGSTGKICAGISEMLSEENIENYIIYSNISDGRKSGIGCSGKMYIKVQALKSKVLGNYGFNSKKATCKMIKELEKIRPDIVHLHNIHGHDCNLDMLFTYFRNENIKLIWTFHDCWAFTAYCPHFLMAGCDKWKDGCSECSVKREFSWFCDRSSIIYGKKKKLFSDLDLTIVTPSEWLAGLVKQSFMKDYKTEVIGNGIDLDVFKPTESDFRSRYGLENKKVVLGVSFGWSKKKGLDVFLNLAERLSDKYSIVLVGTDSKTDKQLPCGVISIHRTNDQKELAEIYSAADVFVNPSKEETYPTVNMEALSCGTPVVTFGVGGSAEMIDDTCGSVVECNDIETLEKEIERICNKKTYDSEACLKKACGFDKKLKLKEYLSLYRAVSAKT